tara:strand:+ start:777 stop:962 length:186 start_codon:yes stop_codon:yes gene_type:complete
VLYSAWDVEGHLGDDGRFYFLDFARAMPSDPIRRHHWFRSEGDAHVKNAMLVTRFRPELVR